MTKQVEIHRGVCVCVGGEEDTQPGGEIWRASGTKAVIRGARLMLMLQSPGGGGARTGRLLPRRSEGC